MGWIKSQILAWSTRKMRRELMDFLHKLKAMDDEEVGFVVAMATDVRHAIATRFRWDLLDPIVLEAHVPMVSYELVKFVQNLQRQGAQPTAAGAMVWVHTTRSANNLDIRALGREMWSELARGFRYAEAGAEGYHRLTGAVLRTDGCNLFPKGLVPKHE